MAMADSLFSAVMLIVLFGSAAANKTILFPGRGLRNKVDPANPPGLCNSLISGSQGYSCEEHTVLTTDGFTLSLQRISSEKSSSGSPVMVVHGVFMDAKIWTILPSDVSLPFLLVDKGFDVWLLNTRGTKPSRSKKNIYSTRSSKKWDWSWDALAIHDFPKTALHIFNKTEKKPHFIGHSTACLSALVGLARYGLEKHIKAFVLLGPIANMGRVSSPLARLTAYSHIAQTKRFFWIHRFNPMGRLSRAFFRQLCKLGRIDCRKFLDLLTGHNCCIRVDEMHALLQYKLQPTSVRTIDHLSQMIRTGRLERYNFGSKAKNFANYKRYAPEAYNLADIPRHVPIFLSHGKFDKLADGMDVTLLKETLQSGRDEKKLKVHYLEDYAHADFILSYTAWEAVYGPLIEYLQSQ